MTKIAVANLVKKVDMSSCPTQPRTEKVLYFKGAAKGKEGFVHADLVDLVVLRTIGRLIRV